MRREPEGVSGIAGIAASQMIVDAALAHLVERQKDDGFQIFVTGSEKTPPKEVEQEGHGEFRGSLQSAFLPIGHAGDRGAEMIEHAWRGQWPWRHLVMIGQTIAQGGDIVGDALALFGPGLRDGTQDFRKSRTTVARGRREIGSAPERLSAGCEEHGQRPTTLLAEHRQGGLVDRVQIRALLPVDLDIDE